MRNALIGLTIALAAVPANAQGVGEDSMITLWVRGYPITRGGELAGCSLEYNAAGRDFVYKAGGTFGVVGNITVNKAMNDGQPVLFGSLKVILNDVVGDNPVPATPHSIHLVTAKGQVITGDRAKAFDSDTAGGRVQPFQLDQSFAAAFESIVGDEKIIVAFNRREGGTDIRVPVDLTVRDFDASKGFTRSPEMLLAFADCMTKLLPKD